MGYDFFRWFSSSLIFEAISYFSSSRAVCSMLFNSSLLLFLYSSCSLPDTDSAATTVALELSATGFTSMSSSSTMPALFKMNS